MQELITEIAIYLGLACLLGFLLAYLIWGLGQRRRIESARAAGAAAVRTSVDGDSPLRTQIEDLTRERDRLEHRVEVLSARVASMMESNGAAMSMDEVESALGTVNVEIEKPAADALDVAAASFPAAPEPEAPDTSIFDEYAEDLAAASATDKDGDQKDRDEEVGAEAGEGTAEDVEPQRSPQRKLFQRRHAEALAQDNQVDDPADAGMERIAGDDAVLSDTDTDTDSGEGDTGAPQSDTLGGADRLSVEIPDRAEDALIAAGAGPLAAAADTLNSGRPEDADTEAVSSSDPVAEPINAAGDEAAADVGAPETRGINDVAAPGTDDADATESGPQGHADPARPSFILGSEPAASDDLTRIKGIGKATESALNGNGIWQFSQIAAMTEEDRAWVRNAIGGLPGRMTRDRWIEQAQELMKDDAAAE